MTKTADSMRTTAIVPTYADAVWIMEAIGSIQAQTIEDLEIIVLDDGSSTEIQSRLKAQISTLNDIRIQLVLSRKNRGSARIRNLGIRMARGRYIAFLDGDDLWEPDKLECQIRELSKTGAGFSCTSYSNFKTNIEDGSIRQPSLNITYESLLRENEIGCSTVLIDTNRLGRTYFPAIRMRQDYALWLRLLRQGARVAPIQDVLTHRRLHPTALSANKFKALKYTWRMFRDIENFGRVRSAALIFQHVYNGFRRSRR